MQNELQSPLGFATLDKAAALPIATSTPMELGRCSYVVCMMYVSTVQMTNPGKYDVAAMAKGIATLR